MFYTHLKGKLNVITLCLLLISVISFGFYIQRSHHRIAYVRTAELVYGYNGMRDAHSTYKSQADVWEANVDTLRMQYQRCLAEYQQTYKTLSEQERLGKQALIKKLETNLTNYSSAVKDQAQEKEKEMTDAVLNQINSYVEEYAKKQGYDFIMGTTNGNIIYGDKAYDITDEVLLALNKEYKIMPAATEPEKQAAGTK